MSEPEEREEQRALAAARLRYEVLSALHTAIRLSGITRAELVNRLPIQKSAISMTLNGRGNIQPDTIAMYLAAMGFELELKLVPLGTARKRAEEEMAAALQLLHEHSNTTKSRVALLLGVTPEDVDRLGGIEE
jgi:transcriptional regulator with XRE-family HTH domain